MKLILTVAIIVLLQFQSVQAQEITDYFPLEIGNEWFYHSDSMNGGLNPYTYARSVDGVDTVLGQPNYRLTEIFTADNDTSEDRWYNWIREDTTGLLISAFGFTNDLDSASIYDPPLLWFSNSEDSWSFENPDWGGHVELSVDSVQGSITIPAGTFSDLMRLNMIITDSLGDTVQTDNYYYAFGVGEILNEGWSNWRQNYRFELTSYSLITGVQDRISDIVPSKFDLSQNHPNPFNPMTSIRYSLPVSGEVTLIIYNLLGEEIARLVDGFQQAGEYNSTWNATNVSSGIYFYRLRAGDYTVTKKMVLLK